MRVVYLICLSLLAACVASPDSNEPVLGNYSTPQQVTILDYDGHIMEPFLSTDGATLFFNNENTPKAITNLHCAQFIDSVTFKYRGEIQNANTNFLDAVASMDYHDNLYFISTRSYEQALSSIYCGTYTNQALSNIQVVANLSENKPGWINFDAEVSKDGNYLFFADGRFDEFGGPYEANIALATKTDGEFHRNVDQSVLSNINTGALEYAASISADLLELYFTRIDLHLTKSTVPHIYHTERTSVNQAFNKPTVISEISGFAEAVTIAPDGKTLYYHQNQNGKYVLFTIKKLK